MAACAVCSATLSPTARFCADCGTPAVAAPGREVRKTVTLLFTDVTGSTAMGEGLDPEAYRGIMGRYFEVARVVIERHGGTVEKFVVDCVPGARSACRMSQEDDALRVVRAAHCAQRGLAQPIARLANRLATSRSPTCTGVTPTAAVTPAAARAGGRVSRHGGRRQHRRAPRAGSGAGEILLGPAT